MNSASNFLPVSHILINQLGRGAWALRRFAATSMALRVAYASILEFACNVHVFPCPLEYERNNTNHRFIVNTIYVRLCRTYCLTFYIPSGCKFKTTGTTSQQDPLEWLAWRFSLKEEVKYLCTWKVTRNKQYWPNCRLPRVKLQANQNSNSKAQNVHHVAAQKGLQWLQETWHTYWLSLSASQLRLLGIHGLTTICGTELP